MDYFSPFEPYEDEPLEGSILALSITDHKFILWVLLDQYDYLHKGSIKTYSDLERIFDSIHAILSEHNPELVMITINPINTNNNPNPKVNINIEQVKGIVLLALMQRKIRYEFVKQRQQSLPKQDKLKSPPSLTA